MPASLLIIIIDWHHNGMAIPERAAAARKPRELHTAAAHLRNSEPQNDVLEAAAVRGVTYAAVRTEDKGTGKTYTLCAVVPFSNSRRKGFGFKVMNETMGPYEADCPDHIMRLLSPVPEIPHSSSAGKWRRRVKECKAAREAAHEKARDLQPGAVLRFNRPIRLSSGMNAQEFCFIGRFRRSLLIAPTADRNLLCRLRPCTIAEATIIAGEKP